MPRVLAALAAIALLAGCADPDPGPIGGPIFDGTTPDGSVVLPPITTLPAPDVDAIRVPVEFFTIQEAVNAAQPGDLVLIDPGVYTEQITVTSPDIVIRGRDRDTVFVDGLHNLTTGFTVLADGVVIENLTVRNYTLDAIAIGEETPTGRPAVNRARVGYVTTSNTGRHGVAARGASQVEVLNGWNSGHGGAGVSIENCSPCDSVIRDGVVEFSAQGYALTGTDTASLVNSVSRNNRVGVVVEDGQIPSVDVVVAGNLVQNNGFSNTPQIDATNDHGYGAGVHVIGSTGTRIVRNRLSGNIGAGILVASSVAGPAPPFDLVLDGNDFSAQPTADVVDVTQGQEWAPISAPTIPYVNGPVPQSVPGLVDADSTGPISAGAVTQPDLATVG